MSLLTLGIAGGLFALLALVHFIVDWVFQTHSEAMVKHNNAKVRAKHCLIYTLGFIPLLYFFNYSLIEWLIAINVLFWSHFVEDTYMPVFFWAKYIRKPPEMFDDSLEKEYFQTKILMKSISCDENFHAETLHQKFAILVSRRADLAKKGFIEFVQTPLGKILMIAIDQIIHLSFLIPLVWMALN